MLHNSFGYMWKAGLLSRLVVIVMGKSILASHAVSVLIACCLLVSLYLSPLPLPIGYADPRQEMSRTFMGVFAGIGVFTGVWLMAKRQGKNESVVLAISTLVAFFVLIIVF